MQASLTLNGHNILHLGAGQRPSAIERLAAATRQIQNALADQAREVAEFQTAMGNLQTEVDILDASLIDFQAKTTRIDVSGLCRSARKLEDQADAWAKASR